MADRAERAVLEDVEKNGDVLRLADGRRLAVSPDDAEAASIWMYEAELTLRERKTRGRQGKRPAFNVSVTNEDTGETVAARLLERSNPGSKSKSKSESKSRSKPR
jgi:hypothetical protein